jgi:hypothetical protein
LAAACGGARRGRGRGDGRDRARRPWNRVLKWPCARSVLHFFFFRVRRRSTVWYDMIWVSPYGDCGVCVCVCVCDPSFPLPSCFWRAFVCLLFSSSLSRITKMGTLSIPNQLLVVQASPRRVSSGPSQRTNNRNRSLPAGWLGKTVLRACLSGSR